MKKTIFEGVVNGAKFDNVDDYNKAVKDALAEGKNVEASSSTHIEEVDEKCKCEQCSPMDFNFKDMMKKSSDELADALEQLATNFKQLPDDYKKSLLHIIKDTKVIAERQMKVTEKDIDATDAQSAEIQDQIDTLEKQLLQLDQKANKAEEVYDKLAMVVDSLDNVLEENEETECEELSISELWKRLFGMPSPQFLDN